MQAVCCLSVGGLVPDAAAALVGVGCILPWCLCLWLHGGVRVWGEVVDVWQMGLLRLFWGSGVVFFGGYVCLWAAGSPGGQHLQVLTARVSEHGSAVVSLGT